MLIDPDSLSHAQFLLAFFTLAIGFARQSLILRHRSRLVLSGLLRGCCAAKKDGHKSNRPKFVHGVGVRLRAVNFRRDLIPLVYESNTHFLYCIDNFAE